VCACVRRARACVCVCVCVCVAVRARARGARVYIYIHFFIWHNSPPVGHGLLIHEVSRSHNDPPHSVGLLWTSDQFVAETSTWQHTTLTTDKHPCPHGGIRALNLCTRAAVDLRLRPRGQWERLYTLLDGFYWNSVLTAYHKILWVN